MQKKTGEIKTLVAITNSNSNSKFRLNERSMLKWGSLITGERRMLKLDLEDH